MVARSPGPRQPETRCLGRADSVSRMLAAALTAFHEMKTGVPSRGSQPLALPPPPTEEWNEMDEEDDEALPGQRFARFRPDQKRLKEFLHSEDQAVDYSWLLVAGLGAFALALFSIMMGLIVVFFWR